MFGIIKIFKKVNWLETENKLPKYIKVKEDIKTIINNEDYSIGDKLPGENTLCKEIDASKVTVHKALRELQDEGYIRRKRGSGTTIIKKMKKYDYDLTKVGRLNDVIQGDYKIETKMLRIIEKKAGKKIAEKLKIDRFEKVIEYLRLRSIDSIAAVYSIDNIAKKRIPDDISIENIGPSISRALGMEINHTFSRIIPVRSDLNICYFLDIPPGSICLLLEEITYDKENIPIDYSYEYYPEYLFNFNLFRNHDKEYNK